MTNPEFNNNNNNIDVEEKKKAVAVVVANTNSGDVTIVEEDELSSAFVNGYFGKTAAAEDEEEEVSEEEAHLFDSSLLEKLDFSHLSCFSPRISPAEPGEGLRVRALASGDFNRGFLQNLSQLTSVGDVSRGDFLKRFSAMKACQGTYYVTVIEDTVKKQIIGSASLVVEKKFIRNCASRGIVEEVVVSDQYRGKQLGKLIVATVVELGKSLGCYKITLNCTDRMIGFYTSLGFKQEEGNANFLMLRLQ